MLKTLTRRNVLNFSSYCINKKKTPSLRFFSVYNSNNLKKSNVNYLQSKIIKKNHEIINPLHLIHSRYASITIKVPNMGDSISEGTLVEWAKKEGEYCKVDDIVAIIETDKVSIDIRTDQGGVLKQQLAKIDDTLQVGAPLFIIDTDGKPSATSTPSASSPSKPTESKPSEPKSTPPPQPQVQVQASKPTPPSSPSPPKSESKPSTPSSSSITSSNKPSGDRSENRVQLSRMRLRIAERLKEAQNTAASLTTFNEINMSNVIKLRNLYKDDFEKKHGVKLGFMSFFVKASVSALQEQPAVNAYIDLQNKEFIYHNYCDVSVAVASPNGLVVPVIRNAHLLSFADIEKEIAMYSKKAKDGTLTIPDMTGGTFTISNGGVFGSMFGTPILNPPQSAILGMHATNNRPIAINDKTIEVAPIMYIALTYDHRIIDGREAVLFLKRIKHCIEDPSRLLLDV